MLAKVSLPLSAVLRLLNPPETVQTVDDYRNYISETLQGCEDDSAQPARKPGRPLKNQHAYYSNDELQMIKAYIRTEIASNSRWFVNDRGRATGLGDQTDMEEDAIRLDNGQIVHFSGRIPFVNGEACPPFPPSISQ